MRHVFSAVIFFLSTATADALAGSDIDVDDYANIAAAVAASSNGDTIYIPGGIIYTEDTLPSIMT